MRKLIVLSALILAFGGATSTAQAHSLTASEKLAAKKTYYHANGYIHAIWKNARRTVYHPDKRKAAKWWATLKFLKTQKHAAWVKLHPAPVRPPLDAFLVNAFTCIHHYEGAWNANTGNGYYGGLQMDLGFQSTYGGEFLKQYGTADRWPVWAQLTAAIRAYRSGRGFGPWPSTARACGLL